MGQTYTRATHATTTHHARDDAPQDQTTPAVLNLPEDVENSIACLLALKDLANARRVHRKLAGWKYGPNVTEIQLPSKYIPTLLGYYTPEKVIRIDTDRLKRFAHAHLLAISSLSLIHI